MLGNRKNLCIAVATLLCVAPHIIKTGGELDPFANAYPCGGTPFETMSSTQSGIPAAAAAIKSVLPCCARMAVQAVGFGVLSGHAGALLGTARRAVRLNVPIEKMLTIPVAALVSFYACAEVNQYAPEKCPGLPGHFLFLTAVPVAMLTNHLLLERIFPLQRDYQNNEADIIEEQPAEE